MERNNIEEYTGCHNKNLSRFGCIILRMKFELYTNIYSTSLVIILTLPSLSLMFDLVANKDYALNNLLGALFYPITMVLKAFILVFLIQLAKKINATTKSITPSFQISFSLS